MKVSRALIATVGTITITAGAIAIATSSVGGASDRSQLRSSQNSAAITNGGFIRNYTHPFVDGEAQAATTLSVSSGGTFTWGIGFGDSGVWTASGKSFAMEITGGSDAPGQCIFVATYSSTQHSLGTATKPGTYTCPGNPTTGTWYAKP